MIVTRLADRAEVGVLEEADEVRLGRFLRAKTADDWKPRSPLKSAAISRTRRWKGGLRSRAPSTWAAADLATQTRPRGGGGGGVARLSADAAERDGAGRYGAAS